MEVIFTNFGQSLILASWIICGIVAIVAAFRKSSDTFNILSLPAIITVLWLIIKGNP
jgi:hypothetical protein